MQLENSRVIVTYNPDYRETIGIFSLSDREDQYNLPRAYNEGKRGHERAWKALEQAFNQNTSFNQAIDILDNEGMKIHSYCSMD